MKQFYKKQPYVLFHNKILVLYSHKKMEGFQKIISIWQDGWSLMACNITHFA